MSKEYFEKAGYVSNSLLKATADHPKYAKSMIEGKEFKTTPALDYGTLVDVLITQPDRLHEEYVIYRGKKPTDKLLEVAEEYIRLVKETPEEEFDKTRLIISAQNNIGYDGRLKPETMVKRFEEECEVYCNFAVINTDKIIIDQFTFDNANRLAMNTRTSPYLQHIFEPNSNYIVLFQVPIYITTTKFVGKLLIDCIVIDLVNKTITPYDFKTFEGSFEQNYWSYKYYYQETWYSFILNTLCNPEMFIDCTIPDELSLIHSGEYTIEQFTFIAIDKSEFKEVELFQSYKGIIDDVFFKGVIDKGEYKIKIKSIASLIDELKDRVESGNWRDDYQMITNGFKRLWL